MGCIARVNGKRRAEMLVRQKARWRRFVQIEIIWSPLAQARIQEIHAYLSLDKPSAANEVAKKIVESAESLRKYPRLGRERTARGIRGLIVAGTPYVLLYRIRRRQIIILTVWHAAHRERIIESGDSD